MKTNVATALMVAGVFGGFASGVAQTENSSEPEPPGHTSGPRIEFATTVFDFGKISSGEVVRHDFVFTNVGNATLEIKEVRPGCGCTTAGTWDKQVEPGKTGTIPLQLNSANFGGAVTKSATVTCNDPGKPKVMLQFTGTVWKPIEVTPTTTVFNVSDESETNVTKVVRIVNNLEEPLKLSDLKCTNQVFRAELKTVRPDKEFELHITAVPPFPGTSISAPVTLKTSSEKMPTINVTAYVAVQPAVAVMPNQILLPAGPLAKAMNPKVMIRSNGANSLVLSEASANIPEAEVRLEETQPGRLFNLAVSFPAGFQIQPDQKVEVTVKSNHPKFPLIKVPVVQSKSAAAGATARLQAPDSGSSDQGSVGNGGGK
jgi:Protein of unknown function (DUF1573)